MLDFMRVSSPSRFVGLVVVLLPGCFWFDKIKQNPCQKGCSASCPSACPVVCKPLCDATVACGAADGCNQVCAVGSGCTAPGACVPVCDASVTCGASDTCSGTCAVGSGCTEACAPACSSSVICGASDSCSGTCEPGSGCSAVVAGADCDVLPGMLDPAAPVILFTDLVSGPNSGGVGGNGVFLTLYGLRFGAQGAGDKVTIGGTEVAAYTFWNPSDPNALDPDQRLRARGLQTITIQPGAAISGDNLEVKIVAGGKASNAVKFSAKSTGKIWFVDSGYGGGANDGSALHPFTQLGAVKKAAGVVGGDVVYIKGSFTPPDAIVAADVFVLDDTTRPNTATGAAVAYVGYPGAAPTLGGATAGSPATTALLLTSAGSESHLVFANLQFVNATTAIQLDHAVDIRVIGNRFVGITSSNIDSQTLTGVQILGNYVHSSGGGVVSESNAASASDIAWNEIFDSNNGVGIGDAGSDVRVFGNLFVGVNFEDIISGAAAVFNNIFAENGNDTIVLVPGGSSNVLIANNTFFQVTDGLGEGSGDTPTDGTFVFRNNLILSDTSYVTFPGDAKPHAGFAAVDHNVYSQLAGGTSIVCNLETDARIFTSPASLKLTTSTFDTPSDLDVTPLTGSPLIDTGFDTSLCGDYYGIKRPQGTAYDVGAVEAP